jgi:hypothetical protein
MNIDRNSVKYLRDRIDLDPDTMEALLDYFGNDATVEEISSSHFRGVLENRYSEYACSWEVAVKVIERARLGVISQRNVK